MNDSTVFDAIAKRLAGTGAFDLIAFGSAADRDRAPADRSRVVSIMPDEYASMEEDGSPDRLRRTVEYGLAIKVRGAEDPAAAYGELDLLTAVMTNALQGKDYGGLVIAWRSNIAAGRVDDGRFPELRYVARGTFSYVVDATAGGLSTVV